MALSSKKELDVELSQIKKIWISTLSVKRPVTVLTLLASLLVVGFIAYTKIPSEMMPRGMTFPFLSVYIPYPNATPQEIEDQLARPLEEMMRTVNGIEEMRTSSSERHVWCGLEFRQNVDMEVAYAEVRDRTERLLPQLPDDVDRIWIWKYSNEDDPIVWFVAAYDNDMVDDPYFMLDTHVKRRLERVAGVARVEMWGTEEKEIMIDVDQDRVRAQKVNLYNVIQALQRDNFTMTSGFVKDGSKKLYVRSIGKLPDINEIGNLPVGDGNVRLKDIAEIVYDIPGYQWFSRAGRQRSVGFGVYKTSMANTAQTCDEIEKIINEEFRTNPELEGINIDVLYNQGFYVHESIRNLINTATWGGFFAFLILYVFLRRFRMTLLINLAIPLSLLITITVLYFLGWTLNAITMMGLMISVGLVVDNAIVIVENIYRLKAEGLSDQDSAIYGSSQVGLAITLATLTTVVVFLPLILMNDDAIFSWYMFRIGLPVMAALIASLFVALIFIPLATTQVSSGKPVKPPKFIDQSIVLYEKALKWTLRRPLDATVIIIFLMMSMSFAASQLGQTDEGGNINNFGIWLEFPQNNNIQRTYDIVRAIEDTVYAKEDEYNLKTVVTRFRRTRARLNVFLRPPPEQQWYHTIYYGFRNMIGMPIKLPMIREDVIEDVKKRLPKFSGVDYRFNWQSSGGSDAIRINLKGEDTSTLLRIAKEAERRLRTIPDIISTEIDLESGNDEVQVWIDRELSQKYGFDPQIVAGTISYALRGIDLPDYRTENREIPMSIGLKPEDRRTLEQLKNLSISSIMGTQMPLATFSDFHISKGLGEIRRTDGKTALSITVYANEDDLESLGQKIDAVMDGFQMPRGYEWSKGQRFRRMQESNESQQLALLLAITFVFLLMGTLFESFIMPLAIIVSIPLSFFGAYWILFLTNTPLGMMVIIGLVILVGIVVNNAIVLVDMINRFRQAGYDRWEAIIEAGKHRFRPIMMTAFTTVCGLIPMALGNSAVVGMPYAPMGRALIGGLLTSTLLTLLVVPLLYVFLDDLREWIKVRWNMSR